MPFGKGGQSRVEKKGELWAKRGCSIEYANEERKQNFASEEITERAEVGGSLRLRRNGFRSEGKDCEDGFETVF